MKGKETMKQEIVIRTHIEDALSNYWLFMQSDNAQDIEPVHDEESIAKAAKAWKMTPEAVKAIKDSLDYLAETLVDYLKEDLQDLWKETKNHEQRN
jgi:hypothetical protein